MVGCGADMARVHKAAVGDAPSRRPDVGRGVDDGRVLAPEFQHGRGEVLGGGLVHDLAHWGAAGEKDEVPLLVQQNTVVSGTPPNTTATASVSRYFGTISAVCWAHASGISDGLSTAVFPAAMAATSGARVSMYGSFQAPMISVTPSGSRRRRTCPGSMSSGVCTRSGLIQWWRCLRA